MKIFFFLILVLSSQAFGKRFSNNFLEFELPVGWECQMEGAEWVCQSTVKERGQEAIIIFAAKKRGKMDDFQYYQSYLKKKKTYKLPGGKVQVSDPKVSKVTEVNGHRWVDALHLSSEIPGFYTRYLATVKEDLGVAMTFSVSRREYRNYKTVFEKIVNSLRVFRTKGAEYNKGSDNAIVKTGNENIFNRLDSLPDEVVDITRPKESGSGASSLSDGKDSFLYIVVLVVVVAFFIMKKKS